MFGQYTQQCGYNRHLVSTHSNVATTDFLSVHTAMWLQQTFGQYTEQCGYNRHLVSTHSNVAITDVWSVHTAMWL